MKISCQSFQRFYCRQIRYICIRWVDVSWSTCFYKTCFFRSRCCCPTRWGESGNSRVSSGNLECLLFIRMACCCCCSSAFVGEFFLSSHNQPGERSHPVRGLTKFSTSVSFFTKQTPLAQLYFCSFRSKLFQFARATPISPRGTSSGNQVLMFLKPLLW